jgi:hypothetical protein
MTPTFVSVHCPWQKTWLFFDSDQGGKSLAILSNFTATCQQFGINELTFEIR